jgi:hypothetical protein
MRRFLPRLALAFGLGALLQEGRHARAEKKPPTLLASRAADEAAFAISALDLDEAKDALRKGDPGDPAILLEEARLAVYEGRCDDALVTLGTPDVLETESGTALYDIARGCARVTAATVVDTDDAHGVVVRYQDEGDRALTPLIVETVSLAREALTRDLGVSWPWPTRVTVVRDLMSLSAMTGLPQKSAQTTGTVAVAKWGRVTLLSPRASDHGFPWRDTLAHELTHLAVTHATADRAPLWLQEGMAKREETRWRDPGPFDDHPSPEAIVLRGFERHLDTPLDQLGPSIAMLPSADAAMVAFAEVTSFVRYFADTGGADALPNLLHAVRTAADTDTALRDSSGADLHTWDARWRAHLATSPPPKLSGIFGLLGDASPGNLHELRDRVRLAQLLYGREHAAAAEVELDRVQGELSRHDPSVRSLRAHVKAALGQRAGAKEEVGDPAVVASTFGPWWAIRGRLQREDGEGTEAEASFVEAVSTDPLDVEAACEVDDSEREVVDDGAPETPARALCLAARARHEPALGRD